MERVDRVSMTIINIFIPFQRINLDFSHKEPHFVWINDLHRRTDPAQNLGQWEHENPKIEISCDGAIHKLLESQPYFLLNEWYFLVKVQTTKFKNRLYEREYT